MESDCKICISRIYVLQIFQNISINDDRDGELCTVIGLLQKPTFRCFAVAILSESENDLSFHVIPPHKEMG